MTLELISSPGGGACRARLDLANLKLQGFGVQVRKVILAVLHIVRVLFVEEMIVEANFRLQGVLGRNPMECRLYFPSIGGVAASGFGIVGAMEFDDFAVLVMDNALALDKVGIAKSNFTAWRQAIEFRWRLLPKILSLYVKLAREGDFSRAGARILWVVDCFYNLLPVFRSNWSE